MVHETPRDKREKEEGESEQHQRQLEEEIKKWTRTSPRLLVAVTTKDAYKTLVARLSMTRRRHVAEGVRGPTVLLVDFRAGTQLDKDDADGDDVEEHGRGYAFVEFEKEEDMRQAYKRPTGGRRSTGGAPGGRRAGPHGGEVASGRLGGVSARRGAEGRRGRVAPFLVRASHGARPSYQTGRRGAPGRGHATRATTGGARARALALFRARPRRR